jgi:hypothetical protein
LLRITNTELCEERQMATRDSRAEIFVSFLQKQNLHGWFSWLTNELAVQLGHYPHWGLSFLLFLSNNER